MTSRDDKILSQSLFTVKANNMSSIIYRIFAPRLSFGGFIRFKHRKQNILKFWKQIMMAVGQSISMSYFFLCSFHFSMSSFVWRLILNFPVSCIWAKKEKFLLILSPFNSPTMSFQLQYWNTGLWHTLSSVNLTLLCNRKSVNLTDYRLLKSNIWFILWKKKREKNSCKGLLDLKIETLNILEWNDISVLFLKQ